MPDTIIVVLICLIPVALGITLFFIFKRSKSKIDVDLDKIREEIAELESISQMAEYKDAQIVSARPQEQSIYNPGERVVKFRLAIKQSENNYISMLTRWKIDNYESANYQQGATIQVKVYGEYIFPTGNGAKLIPDSVH